jgi:hypothetical protein
VRCREDSVTLFLFFPFLPSFPIFSLFFPARFLGFWVDFGVIWAHAMRPYEFWGYLGARDAPLRVLGLFGRTRRQKPPHQVNLDAFREKIFSVQGILTIEKGTHNQIAGIFPLGMVAQFVEFSWNL